MNLEDYRRAVARSHSMATARRNRLYRDIFDHYCRAKRRKTATVEEAVKWAQARGLLTEKDMFVHCLEDALHGYMDDLRRVADEDFVFLCHPARLVRAAEEALRDGDFSEGLAASIQAHWWRLAEAGDAPFPWPVGVVGAVVAAVQDGRLRSEDQAEV